MSLAGKKIVLGVSGGIAAYKTPELVRRLRDRGADVRVAMTEAAKAFITPLSLQAVSGYPVSDSLLDPAAEAAMGHIELGKWADLVILAPATADLIARVAAGMANDLVSTICLATPAPVAVLPAMNQQMYRAAATQHNLEVLASRGLLIWGPDSGSQACGDIGPGRMLDPLTIVDMAVAHFSPVNDLKHLNIMITAGPTREPLDPVRYISNHSSGKMGFAIAAVLLLAAGGTANAQSTFEQKAANPFDNNNDGLPDLGMAPENHDGCPLSHAAGRYPESWSGCCRHQAEFHLPHAAPGTVQTFC